MLISADRSVLLLIDVQERLYPAVHKGAKIVEHNLWLTRIAQHMAVPVICTEQYPRGLGPTVPALRELLPDAAVIEKNHFSAVADGGIFNAPGGNRAQFIVTGAEAHVCVLQTVLGLLDNGRQVFVIEEAVGSRRASDKTLALERMRRHGADIVSREMVAFEWLRQAGTDLFRQISREFIR